MYSSIKTGTLYGLYSEVVFVETDLSSGLPALTIVGLPDLSVREAKERIRAAILNTGYAFPSKRITINLSPANTKKEGTHFDLPIAMGVLLSAGLFRKGLPENFGFLGELSLDGTINRIEGALPLVMEMRKQGIVNVVLPKENAGEVDMLENVRIYPVGHFKEVAEHFRTGKPLFSFWGTKENFPQAVQRNVADYADVAGQENAKRAVQIAAAGRHNLLLLGTPGTGKTMIAQRISTILPPLSYEEQIEVAKIQSVAGLHKKESVMRNRPFRSPHHSISEVSLIGGGTKLKPGEISLAHHGVLFLDELPEFSGHTLALLRQPLEEGSVTIGRNAGTVTYPAGFMLIAAMNPCPCGYYGDATHRCSCTPSQIQAYLGKVPGPLLDRVDLHLELLPPQYAELSFEQDQAEKSQSSRDLKQGVDIAVQMQKERYEHSDIRCNSQLTPMLIKKYCALDGSSKALSKKAFERFALSARAHHKLLRVARTISDLAGEEQIREEHLAEAIFYRCLDRLYREI